MSISRKILDTAPIQFFKRKLQHVIIPGTANVSMHEVIKTYFHGINQSSITLRASAAAYRFFIALFPGIIFLFSLIPYIPIDNFQRELLEILHDVLPKNAYELTAATFEDMVKNPRGGLLSFGFISALYFSTNGIHTMIDAFNHSIHVDEKRTGFRQRLVSVILLFILFLLIVIAIALLIISGIILNYLSGLTDIIGQLNFIMLQVGQWIILFALIFLVVSFLYWLGPAKKVRFRFFNPGAIFASLMIVLSSVAFSFYVNNFGQFNKLYGSLGTVIVIMLWIYFNSLFILSGFELNASIYYLKKKKSQG